MGHTTFIVGAGASCEFGLMDGARLRDRIAAGLQRYRPIGVSLGSHEEMDAKITLARALPTALSIDDCLHTHSGNDGLRRLGKWAIVHEILQQERESCLTLDRDGLNFVARERASADGKSLVRLEAWNSWLVALFRLLTAECPAEEIPARLNKVSFIVFNYDRCVEHTLIQLLTMKLSDRRKAVEMVKGMQIHHAYGCIASPWDEVFTFGREPDEAPYGSMMQRIRTFTEQPDDQHRTAIIKELHKAATVVFLGFSFLSLNMRFLAHPGIEKLKPQQCWGTAYRSSPVDRDHAVRAITSAVKCKPSVAEEGGRFWPKLYDMTCADFIMHNQRAFDFSA